MFCVFKHTEQVILLTVRVGDTVCCKNNAENTRPPPLTTKHMKAQNAQTTNH